MSQHLLAHIRPDSLHHAYCISGLSVVSAADSSAVHSDVAPFFAFLETHLGIATRGNPDFWHGQFGSLGIDEARQIKDMQQRAAAVVGAKKVFVISTDTITHEAQNALLKVFEEPTVGTHFFLLMPSAEGLLPTLRSRLVMVPGVVPDAQEKLNNPSDTGATVETFLSAPKGKRLTLLKSIIEEKDKRAAIAMVDVILRKLSKDSKKSKDHLVHQKDLEMLLEMRGYLNDRSASVKMILEYIAVSLR